MQLLIPKVWCNLAKLKSCFSKTFLSATALARRRVRVFQSCFVNSLLVLLCLVIFSASWGSRNRSLPVSSPTHHPPKMRPRRTFFDHFSIRFPIHFWSVMARFTIPTCLSKPIKIEPKSMLRGTSSWAAIINKCWSIFDAKFDPPLLEKSPTSRLFSISV